MPLDWAFAFKSLNPPLNYNTIFHVIQGKEVAHARNEFVKVAIEKDAKYLFLLGDDTVVPNHTLRQLIFRMEQDPTVGVVGGVYCCKSDPPYPLVFRGNGKGSYWDWKIGEYFEVTGLGMDCTLIRVDLLRSMGESDWFLTVSTDEFLDARNNAEEWTEDLYFLKRVAEETKYKIMCDGSVICSHHDVYGNKVYNLPPDSLPMRQKLVKKDKRALMIGPPLELTDGESFDVTTFGDEGSDYRGHRSTLPFATEEFDWTIVTDIRDISRDSIIEWLRCSRTKLTMTFYEFINIAQVVEHLKQYNIIVSLVKGNMIEVTKNGSS